MDDKASELVESIRKLTPEAGTFEIKRAAYFIWKKPWMTIGHDTYIHDVMKQFGLTNVYGNQSRYPETDFDELSFLTPELILLSSEPYPFKEKHIRELQEVCPESQIMLVNGEWFSWYGSRMLPSFRELHYWRKSIL